jgi:hypothetical protein
MQLGLSFSVLLGSILFALSGTSDAAPIKRNAGFISVPLTRLHGIRSDVSAEVQLQQHMNRAHKRHARMLNLTPLSDTELTRRVHARALPASSSSREKRYNRIGTNVAGAKDEKWTLLNDADLETADDKKHGVKVNSAAAADNSAGFELAALAAQQAGDLTKAKTPTAANSLGLDIEANDIGYIGTAQIGTPPRDFRFLMDSGSADLWVGSETCTNSDTGGDCGTSHTFLGPRSSSSFIDTQEAFAVTYGAGSVSGTKVADTVSVAGLTLSGHVFGVATQESDEFADNGKPFDGIMGLAQSGLSRQQVQTIPEALATAGLINAPIVSYRLSRLVDGKNDGQATFGGVDPAHAVAGTTVTLNNVATNGFWEAPMTVSVGGADIGLGPRSAILDTGTTLIVAPEADATAVHIAIPGAKSDGKGGFVIPCTTSTQVSLTFGGREFTIDSRDLIFAPVDANNLQGDCISGITSGSIGGDTQWLVGDVFLKNAIFTTDVSTNTISLAKPA